MILGEDSVILFLASLHVNKGVLRTSYKNCRASSIRGVVRDLEVAEGAIDASLAANACLGNELLTLPVPKEDLPIRLSSKRYNHALFTWAEGTGDELLRIVGIAVLNLLWKSFLLLS